LSHKYSYAKIIKNMQFFGKMEAILDGFRAFLVIFRQRLNISWKVEFWGGRVGRGFGWGKFIGRVWANLFGRVYWHLYWRV